MVLLSWALLVAVVIIAFVLQSFDNARAASLEASLAPTRDAVLNAYLRQSIEYGGEQIPFAEYIQMAILIDDKTMVRTKTEAFITLLSPEEKHRIGIYLPGNEEWLNVQETAVQDAQQARTRMILPDGREVEIDYAREKRK
ncbi:hypothetical protein HY492_00315 [Candidatus Woesearchaeota archaeon]|nr:hypothetical protein [Candidatus Woesearchaeota archaeon]